MKKFTQSKFLLIILFAFTSFNLQAQYAVSGADIPEYNGIYYETGTYNDKPLYSNGTVNLYYLDCVTKWAIGEDCDKYSTFSDGDTPPSTDWHQGGKDSYTTRNPIMVAKLNSIAYDTDVYIESVSDDGSFNDTLNILLYSDDNPLTGTNNENFVATGKVVVSNLPAGLTAVVKRTSDSTLFATFTGTATNHTTNDNVSNLTFSFQNSAFTNGNASEIEYSTKTDLKIMFMEKYLVYGATETPEVNDTFFLKSVFNNKPVYSNGQYAINYRGCEEGAKWVIQEQSYPSNNCPVYSTATDGKSIPSSGWYDGGEGDGSSDTIYILPMNGLVYSKTTFEESLANDGSIDNTSKLEITYSLPENNANFSGLNNDDFVAAGKVTVSNLPTGYTAELTRTSDTTLTAVLTGSASSDNVNDLTFAFTDDAFTGISATEVMFSTRNDLEILFHNTYYIASSGGDFTNISEALKSEDVIDGDVLILAAETFTQLGDTIDKSITIRGQGAGKTIIQAHAEPATASDRIFYIPWGNKVVTLENLTIQNGNSSQSGGAIYSDYQSTLTINNCEFINNRTTGERGGAIYSRYGNLIVRNSTFSNNVVAGSFDNINGGGAIGIYSEDSNNKALIENCTFSNNSTNSYGGALWSMITDFKITNSTFTNNSANRGGAIHPFYNRIIDMVNVLVADNTATDGGNDIFNDYSNINANYCLIEDVTGVAITGANNVTGLDPELSALADNGGSTQTCAISVTSPAKDVGTNTDTPELDQRGVAIYNSTKDIGAYEYNIDPTILVSNSTLEFGNVAVNSGVELSYTLSAINLTNNLVITAPAGFEISGFSGDNFVNASPMTIVPDAGFIGDTVIYVKCSPTTNGTLSKIISNVSTDAETANVTVKANACASPTGGNSSVSTPENMDRTFAPTDFIFSDPDGHVFAGIQIISKETNGDLEYDGIDVTDGTLYTDVSKLTFKPLENEFGLAYAAFTFKVRDNLDFYSESVYTMTINVNNPPVVANSIPDGTAQQGVAYNYEVPENTFTDDNEGDVLTYSASLSDNSNLPAWLSFNGTTRTFSGTPDVYGSLNIKVTASDVALVSVSDEFLLTIAPAATGIEDVFDNEFQVYPNPTNGVINVSVEKLNSEVSLVIIDITGKIILNRKLKDSNTKIDLSNQAKGMYLIQLKNNKKVSTKRIIIE